MLGGTMIMEKLRFKSKKLRGRPKALNKATKIVLKKPRYKNRRLDKEAQSHIVSKSNKRVVKSCLKCLKLEAPEMAKKPLLSLPINAQLVSNL